MALFNRPSRTTTVDQFILHRGRSAARAYQTVLNEGIDLQLNSGTSRRVAARALDEKIAQVNSDLAVANIQSLPVSFTDEQGMTLGRRVHR